MAEPFVLTEVDDGISWITMNEPARLNPVNPERVQALNDACLAMSRREDVRVVIITGAGRGFSSGADLSAPVPDDFEPAPGSGSILDEGPGLWTLTAMRQPVIAMVNGPAVGYGAELAIQADIRIAGASARFRLPFSKLGVVSDTGAGTWLLPRLIGWSKAAELLYTSRFIEAEEAKSIGLVNHLVADDDLRTFTTTLAREIAANSGPALVQIKRMIFAGLDERKREHLVHQYFRFRERNTDVSMDSFAARFRRK